MRQIRLRHLEHRVTHSTQKRRQKQVSEARSLNRIKQATASAARQVSLA